jgi:hypothetical protein
MEFFIKRNGTLVLVTPEESELMREYDICDAVREYLGMSPVNHISEHI